MRFVITGATGLIGRALVLRLRSLGHDLVAVTRSVRRAENLLGADATVVSWQDLYGLHEALDGADGVIHLSGEPIADKRWTQAHKNELVSSRVHLTKTLVGMMKRCRKPPTVLVSASAVGFYGDRQETVDEQSPAGEGFTSRLAVAWESAAMRAQTFGVRVVCLRLGLVLNRTGAFSLLRQVYRSRLGARIGRGTHGMSWIHLEDVLGMVVWSLNYSAVQGPLNAVAPAEQTQREVHEQMAAHFGRQWSPPIPRRALRWALGERSRLMTHGAIVRPTKAKRLGYEFAYPTLPDALHQLSDSRCSSDVQIRRAKAGQTKNGTRAQYVLTSRTLVTHPLDEVAPWFETPANLTLMTPKFMRFTILEEDAMAVGAEMTYLIRLFGWTLKWKSLIPIFEPTTGFVDTQIEGPYTLWWHEHRFEAAAEGTWVSDEVYYRLPFGVLGEIVHYVWVKATLQRIFSYRMETMQERFGRQNTTPRRISA